MTQTTTPGSFEILTNKNTKKFSLVLDDRTLDANVHEDWMLAARSLLNRSPENGINHFQIWVNWTEQRDQLDSSKAVDLPGMASLWEELKTEEWNKVKAMRAVVLPADMPYARETVRLKLKKLHENAILPTFGTPGAACFDLYAIMDLEGEVAFSTTRDRTVTLETGWAVEVPEGWVMKIYSRSGQGFKDNTRLANCVGIIDSDYRGPIRVKLTRDDDETILVRAGERVAQAMLERVPVVEFVEIEELSETERGDGAYGSTGK